MIDAPYDDGQTLDAYETAFPVDCMLKTDVQALVTPDLLPKLHALLTIEEIGKASLGIQPHLNVLRGVSCKGCALRHCSHNANHAVSGMPHTFAGIRQGRSEDRQQAASALQNEIIAPETVAALTAEGIRVLVRLSASAKHTRFTFQFEHGDAQTIVSSFGDNQMFVGVRWDRTQTGFSHAYVELPSVHEVKQEVARAIIKLRQLAGLGQQ